MRELAGSHRGRGPRDLWRYGLWMVFALVLWLPASARAQQAQASVDQSQVEVGEPVTLTIQVSGGSASTPAMPRIPDLRIQFTGREESFSLVNSSFNRSLTFSFQVTPMRVGSFTIPSIPVQVEGRTVNTQPVQIQATRGTPPSQGAGGGEGYDSGGPADGDPSEDVFVKLEVDPPQVYEGELVRQTLKVYTGVQVGQSIQVGRGLIPGTIDEPLPQSTQRQYQANVKGRTYQVQEVSWAFYPVSSGTLSVPSIDVTVPVLEERRRRSRRSANPMFDDFFGGSLMQQLVPKTLQTDAQSIEVLPVPKAGRPADFAGLVGRFAVRAEMPDTELSLGDSATMTVTVEGEGNLRDLNLPASSIPEFKIYDDTPSADVQAGRGKIVSRKVFKRAFVPQQSGELTVPPISISYFDPVLRRFVSVATESFKLHVSPGAGGQTRASDAGKQPRGPGKQSVKVTGEDILPIHTGPELSQDRFIGLSSPLALGVLLLPPAAFGAMTALRRRRERQNADPVARRRRQALKTALAGLQELDKGGTDDRARLDRLSRLFRSFVGDKLAFEGAALTSGEARTRLQAAGVSSTLAEEAQQFIEHIEQARYAPGSSGRSMQELSSVARGLMQRLDKELG